ncbi:syntaxin-8 [Drosophila tropicalis]|uniref:syntaxin-8 n=1 Tax=Drosophila tropicalis TaxID=46794 RepID=UPI0035AB9C47
MALVDHDSWDIEYEGCERLRHQLLVQLHERQQLQTVSTHIQDPKYTQLSSSIQTGLEQLAKDVEHLRVVLENVVTWETSNKEELQQRRIDLDKINSHLREITNKFSQSTRADRAAAASSSASSIWQEEASSGLHNIESAPADMASFKLRKEQMLAEQERGLDSLSNTLSRQRLLVERLGNEVEDHNVILDNMANTMDRVEYGVQRETQSISQINRRDSTWGYWLIIICLFVGIIVVVFV